MSNIISSDMYRVRHGAALRNTFIGVVAVIIVVVMVTILISQMGADAMPAIDGMSPAEAAEMQQDLADAAQETANVTGGAAFGLEMLGQFIIPLFFLPIAIAVFCADFTAGTYRNTLSFESGRTKVYLSKLLLSFVLCIALVVGMLIVSWIAGSIAFGFSGFSLAYFGRIGLILLLQLPIYFAFTAVLHFLIAVTKKSSATIAIFLVGFIVLAILFQTLATSNPSLEWMLMLDAQSGGKMMAMYDIVPAANLVFVAVYNIAIAVAATAVGIVWFKKTDMP